MCSTIGTAKFKKSLKDADVALDTERAKSFEKDKIIETCGTEIQRLKFSLYSSEQEIIRLQFLLDNIATIHPGTVKRIQNMPYNQRFPDKAITKYARMRLNGTNFTLSLPILQFRSIF